MRDKLISAFVLVGFLVFALGFLVFKMQLLGFAGFAILLVGVLAKARSLSQSPALSERASAKRKLFCCLLLLPNSFVRLLFFELESSPINVVLDFTGVLLLSGAVAVTFLVHRKIETATMGIFTLTVLLDLTMFAFSGPISVIDAAGFVAMSFASLMTLWARTQIKSVTQAISKSQATFLILLPLILTCGQIKFVNASVIWDHIDLVSQDNKFMVTVYVYKYESVIENKEFYGFHILLHTDEPAYFAWIDKLEITCPNATFDDWQPKTSIDTVGGSISLTPGGPSLSISLSVSSQVIVHGTYTDSISWFINPIGANSMDIDVGAALWVPANTLLRWNLYVKAYSGVIIGFVWTPLWDDYAQWSSHFDLTISNIAGGTTNPPPGVHTYRNGEQVTVMAIPDQHGSFFCWIADGLFPYIQNPITVSMDRDHSVKAYFGFHNDPPYVPSTPVGSTSGYRKTMYTFSSCGSDPENDQIRLEFDWGDGTANWTGYVDSGNTGELQHSWAELGTYAIKVRSEDSYGNQSDWSPSAEINIVNRAPIVPASTSGCTSGYVYTSYHYFASTIDPDDDPLRYEYNWSDSPAHITDWIPSGQSSSDSQYWTRPGTCGLRVRAQDTFGAWSGYCSQPLTVTITQNDAGSGRDAGDTYSTGTYVQCGSSHRPATLYESNPQDEDDWYKFYAETGQDIYISVIPPAGVDIHLQLYDPAGCYLPVSTEKGPGEAESASYVADRTGNWSARVYVYSGEGKYWVYINAYVDPGGDGCPALLSWNGSSYVDHGILDIHDPSGNDVLHGVSVKKEDVAVSGYVAQFRLREGWPGLNFSESTIDQVRLYAVDSQGICRYCPIIEATHSRLGNVLPQLLLDDEYKAQTLLNETINLKFLVLYLSIQKFIFVIEGCNMHKQ